MNMSLGGEEGLEDETTWRVLGIVLCGHLPAYSLIEKACLHPQVNVGKLRNPNGMPGAL